MATKQNFFQKVTFSNTDFAVDPDILIDIRYATQSFSLVNEGTTVIEYSFDGVNLHGDMTPETPTAAIFFDNRLVTKMWFRVPLGGASLVRVEAW